MNVRVVVGLVRQRKKMDPRELGPVRGLLARINIIWAKELLAATLRLDLGAAGDPADLERIST
jgi:hypothetical protein